MLYCWQVIKKIEGCGSRSFKTAINWPKCKGQWEDHAHLQKLAFSFPTYHHTVYLPHLPLTYAVTISLQTAQSIYNCVALTYTTNILQEYSLYWWRLQDLPNMTVGKKDKSIHRCSHQSAVFLAFMSQSIFFLFIYFCLFCFFLKNITKCLPRMLVISSILQHKKTEAEQTHRKYS